MSCARPTFFVAGFFFRVLRFYTVPPSPSRQRHTLLGDGRCIPLVNTRARLKNIYDHVMYSCVCRSHLEYINVVYQVVRFCLQKNPKERPNCASLLSKKFFKRDLQPDGIINELLVHVPVVGEGEGAERRELGCAVNIGAASSVQ